MAEDKTAQQDTYTRQLAQEGGPPAQVQAALQHAVRRWDEALEESKVRAALLSDCRKMLRKLSHAAGIKEETVESLEIASLHLRILAEISEPLTSYEKSE